METDQVTKSLQALQVAIKEMGKELRELYEQIQTIKKKQLAISATVTDLFVAFWGDEAVQNENEGVLWMKNQWMN